MTTDRSPILSTGVCAGASHDFSITVPAEHPAFVGHFPGHPVLPGVVLLAEVVAGVERCLGLPMDQIVIRVAKFHAPVSPGATLTVELVQGNGIAFTIASGETRVASGTLALDSKPQPDTGSVPG